MQIQIKSKRTVMIAAVLTAAIIVITGAFAWSSFMQQRINTFTVTVKPGVNLHDDFDGIDKDVYVENSGDIGIFVRVRLTEYLETVGQGSLVAGQSRGDEQTETDLARRSWTPHNALGEDGHEYCVLPSDDAVSPEWYAGANFHDYYIWTMGGQKYYKPAKKLLTPEEYDAEPPVICNDLDPETGKVKLYDGSELDLDGEPLARETLFAQVMTMEQWIEGGRKIGAFWVIDADGWCYWAQMLNPEEATGLLLDKVERTAKQFDSNVEYCINVWLQAVDEMDAGNLSVPENGGITDNGKLLMQLLTQELLLGDDGYYQDNGNGTFTQISDSDGKPAENAKPFIPIGSGVEQLDNVGKINAPDRLYIDDMLTLTPLVWDGTDYINFTDFDGDAPYYNIGGGDETITIIGVETGEADGVLYLRLSDGTYLASVTKNSPYKQSYPGTGPFAVMYTGEDGVIGTGDTERYDFTTYMESFFYHIGNGVYVQVADKSSTASYDVYNDSADGTPDDNTIYYFSNTTYGSLYEINNLIGGTLEENVKAAFAETLQIGEFFAYHDAPNTGYSTIYKGEDIDAQRALGRVSRTFTMKPIYRHTDGNLYVKTIYTDGEPGHDFDVSQGRENPDFVDYFIKGMGAGGEFGDQYFGVMVQLVGGAMTTPTIQAPMGGGQSAADPFRIESRAQMDWVTARVADGHSFDGEHLRVVSDIPMGEYGFAPIGDASRPFSGSFDGDGYTISGLKIEGGTPYQGLFGHISDAEIKNLAVTGSVTSNKNSVGGIVGYAAGTSKISGCVFSGTVSANGYAGGIVGNLNGGTAENCFVTYGSEITGSAGGGIAGQVYSGAAVRNSYSLAKVTGTTSGGAVGNNSAGTVQNSAFLRIPERNNSLIAVGDGAGTNTAVGYFSDLNGAVNATNGATVAAANLCALLDAGAEGSGKAWVQRVTDGSWPLPSVIRDTSFGNYTPLYETGYAGGYGTEAEPYLIASKTQLEYMRDRTNADAGYSTGKYFKQTADINLNNELWTPVGLTNTLAFKGIYDGDGWKTYGLKVQLDTANARAGLFGTLSEGTVKSLHVEGNVTVTGNAANIGGIAAHMTNSSRISGCVFSGTVKATGGSSSIGGIVGLVNSAQAAQSFVSNCAVIYNSEIIGGLNTGGIVGMAIYADVQSNYSLAKIDRANNTYAGGVVGDMTVAVLSQNAFLRTSSLNNIFNAVYRIQSGSADKLGYFASLNSALISTNSSGAMPASLVALLDAGAAGSGKAWEQNVPGGSWPAPKTIRDRTWCYNVPELYAGGTGTQAAPYLIANAEQLIYMRDEINAKAGYSDGKYFKQTANIDLGNIEWTPIGSSETLCLKGEYDGGGYKISGLKITAGANVSGLFGYIYGGIVKNLHVEGKLDVTNNIAAVVGGIAGQLGTSGMPGSYPVSAVTDCVFSGTITFTGTASYSDVGGIVGRLSTGGQIENCSVTYGSKITNQDLGAGGYAGGIVGRVFNQPGKKVNYNYSLASVTNRIAARAGGICGEASINPASEMKYNAFLRTTAINSGLNAIGTLGSGVVSQVGWFSSPNSALTATNSSGAMPANLLTLLNNGGNAWEQNIPGETWPAPKTIRDHAWCYDVPAPDGTEANPYKISTAADLKALTGAQSNAGKYFVLTNDITISDTTWDCIGAYNTSFAGNFDGKGYSVSFTASSLTLTPKSQSYGGFFASNSGTIKNLVIKYSNIVNYSYSGFAFMGAFVGRNSGTIENCGVVVPGGIFGGGSTETNVGGFVGGNYSLSPRGSIKNCYAQIGTVGLTSGGTPKRAGGFAGQTDANTTISNCYTSTAGIAAISGTVSGGFAGASSGNITYGYYNSAAPSDSKATPLTAASMTNGTLLTLLNQNRGDGKEWVAGDGGYPIHAQ